MDSQDIPSSFNPQIPEIDKKIYTSAEKALDLAFDPPLWALQELKVDLYDNQIEIFENVIDANVRYLTIIGARSSGKTFAVAAGLVKICLDYPGLKIGVFAPKAGQATRVTDEIYYHILRNEETRNKFFDLKRTTKSNLVFKNSSTILAQSAAEASCGEGWHFDILCVAGKTIIETKSGKKTIKELVEDNRIGELIKTFDIKTNEIYWKPIIKVHKNLIENKKILRIKYEINPNEAKELICTADHKIYTQNRDWVMAKDLIKTDDLHIYERKTNTLISCQYIERGEIISIDEIEIKDKFMYDITIKDTHCYFANSVLVHNCVDECFDGKTPIMLTDGSEIEISKLVERGLSGEEFLVASFNEKNQIIPKKVVKFKKMKRIKPLVKVKIEIDGNLKEIICTFDHKFKTWRGWIEASNLTSNDELINL